MGSTEREDVIPPPPAYKRVAPVAEQYQPPPGPPPPLPPAASSSVTSQRYHHLSNGSPKGNSAHNIGPPTLESAPPIYEPFSFSNAYSRSHWSNAPKWHSPPIYHLYHDPNSATITFHIPLPDSEPPCACAADFTCHCDRRRPKVWQATSLRNSIGKRAIELQRISPFSDTRQIAFLASNDKLLGSSSTMSIRDAQSNTHTQIKKKGDTYSYKDLQGNLVSWQRQSRRLELSNAQGLPMAIMHSGTPARLEMTSLAWGRTPSDQIECDYPNCSLQPLFGFVFRCIDCSEKAEDSFDICEPHLAEECSKHNQSHHFIRQPRPFAEFDDAVQEMPLLDAKGMQEERRSHELIVMTLACVLLDG